AEKNIGIAIPSRVPASRQNRYSSRTDSNLQHSITQMNDSAAVTGTNTFIFFTFLNTAGPASDPTQLPSVIIDAIVPHTAASRPYMAFSAVGKNVDSVTLHPRIIMILREMNQMPLLVSTTLRHSLTELFSSCRAS